MIALAFVAGFLSGAALVIPAAYMTGRCHGLSRGTQQFGAGLGRLLGTVASGRQFEQPDLSRVGVRALQKLNATEGERLAS